MNKVLTEEELKTTPLVKIIDEIHKISQYQDGIMLLVREETNNDIRYKLLGEYDKAQNYYLLLNKEIMNRWGFDCNTQYKKVR